MERYAHLLDFGIPGTLSTTIQRDPADDRGVRRFALRAQAHGARRLRSASAGKFKRDFGLLLGCGQIWTGATAATDQPGVGPVEVRVRRRRATRIWMRVIWPSIHLSAHPDLVDRFHYEADDARRADGRCKRALVNPCLVFFSSTEIGIGTPCRHRRGGRKEEERRRSGRARGVSDNATSAD